MLIFEKFKIDFPTSMRSIDEKKSSPAKVEVNEFFTTLIRLILPLYAERREVVPCNLRKDYWKYLLFTKALISDINTFFHGY